MSLPTSVPTVAVRASVQRSVAPDSYVVIARAVAYAADTAAAARALTARLTELDTVLGGLTHLELHLVRGAVVLHPDLESVEGSDSTRPWRASRDVRVAGRDMSQVAELVGAIGRLDGVEIDGPHWQLDRGNPVHGELAAEAVHEAATRAQRYAAALGGTLGRLVELNDTGIGGGERAFGVSISGMSRRQGGPGLEILDYTPQPIEVDAGVEGRWYLNLPD